MEELSRKLNGDIVKLTNEITYHRYLMNKGQLRDFFKELSIAEYIALHYISLDSEMSEIYSGRTYLKELESVLPIYSPFAIMLSPSLWHDSSHASAITSLSLFLFQYFFKLSPPQI